MPSFWPIGTVFLAPTEEHIHVLWPEELDTPRGQALRRWPIAPIPPGIPVQEVFVRGITEEPVGPQAARHLLEEVLPPVASQPLTFPGPGTLLVRALDFHTLRGKGMPTPLRTPVGELLYRVKYGNLSSGDQDKLINFLASTLAYQIRRAEASYEAIVPVPPSMKRIRQPVLLLAQALGNLLGLPVSPVLHKEDGVPVKDIPSELRAQELGKRIRFQKEVVLPERILLLDDIVGTGSTLEVCQNRLLSAGARLVEAWVLTVASSQDPSDTIKAWDSP